MTYLHLCSIIYTNNNIEHPHNKVVEVGIEPTTPPLVVRDALPVTPRALLPKVYRYSTTNCFSHRHVLLAELLLQSHRLSSSVYIFHFLAFLYQLHKTLLKKSKKQSNSHFRYQYVKELSRTFEVSLENFFKNSISEDFSSLAHSDIVDFQAT